MSKKTTDELRNLWINRVIDAFKNDEDLLRISSGAIAIPCVDSEGNDAYVEITVKVPTGSRDGDAYDGYALAQEYEMKQKEKAEKAKVAAEKKAAKIARDTKRREQLAQAKAEREAAQKN